MQTPVPHDCHLVDDALANWRQCRLRSTGEMCSVHRVPVTSLAEAFCSTDYRCSNCPLAILWTVAVTRNNDPYLGSSHVPRGYDDKYRSRSYRFVER